MAGSYPAIPRADAQAGYGGLAPEVDEWYIRPVALAAAG
jgi:hypothetical protein